MESGRDEEEETLDDSLEETSVPVKLRRNGEQKRPEGRAPTMTIEIVRVGRPLKVLSLLSGIISLLLFAMGAAGTSWIYTTNYRFGLFQECANIISGSDGTQTHFWDNCDTVIEPELNCKTTTPTTTTTTTTATATGSGSAIFTRNNWLTKFSSRYMTSNHIIPTMTMIIGYRLLCTVFDLLAILLTLIGIFMLAVGMISLNVKRKTIMYKVVLVDFALAFIVMAVTVILFPIQMSEKIRDEPSEKVYVGWSCIVSAVGCLMLITATIFLTVDRKSEEITYRETIHRFPGPTEEEG